MSSETTHKANNEWMVFMTAVLPVIYGLSFGPVVGYSEHHHLSWMDSFCRKFYAPVVWLHDNTSLKGVIERYAHFWGVK